MEYYHILDASPQATSQEIKRAYRRQARRCHPDAHPPEGRAWARTRMAQLNEAYSVLSDPSRRARYDARHRQPDRTPEQAGQRFSWDPPLAEAPLRTRPASFPTLSHPMGALTMLLGLIAMWAFLHPAAVPSLPPWLLAGLASVICGGPARLMGAVVLTRLSAPDSASLAPVFLTVFIVAVMMALVAALTQWRGS